MNRKFSKIATYELSLIITIENKQITFMPFGDFIQDQTGIDYYADMT